MASSNVVPMKSLLEAGVHFGHRTRRWDPKMKPYIFTERNGIHIIDLQQTISFLNIAYDVVRDTVASGGIVLFVGTKKQAQESLVEEAARCGMPYVEQRWLGGTLTNWRTIRQRIDYLLDLEKKQARGEFSRLIKKEALMREREIARLNYRLGGLKEMRRLPNLIFVVDIRRDTIAIKEANTLGIPIVAMVDTNCDPNPIDFIIPSNDDAIRAIKLMNHTIASAVLEGQAIQSSLRAEEDEVETLQEDEAMERYLGPSTLAKIQEAQSSVVFEEDDDDYDIDAYAAQAGEEVELEQDDEIDDSFVEEEEEPQVLSEEPLPQESPEEETEAIAVEEEVEEAVSVEVDEPVAEEQA